MHTTRLSASEAVVPAYNRSPLAPEHRGRQRHLDGLRGMAAMFVIGTHAYQLLAPRGALGNSLLGGEFLSLGHLAVTVFIVLSGWSLALPLRRTGGNLTHGTWGFYVRRAYRIVPTFWAALIFSGVVFWLLTRTPWPAPGLKPQFDPPAIGLQATLLTDFLSDPHASNHSYWSIPVEAHIYILFPLILWGFRKMGLVKTAVSTFLVAVGLEQAGAHNYLPHVLTTNIWISYYGYFALAAGACLLTPRLRRWAMTVRPLTVICFAVFVAVIVLKGFAWSLLHIAWMDVPWVLGFVCLLIACDLPNSRARQVLAFGFLPEIGLRGYSLYLLHEPIVLLTWRYAIYPLKLPLAAQFIVLLAVSVPLCIGAAFGFFAVVEKHFLRLPQLLTRERADRAVAVS